MDKPGSSFENVLEEATYLADKIRSAKQVTIDLDNERQKYRECERSIKSKNIDPVWVFNGTAFFKTSQKKSLEILESDKKTVEDAIEQVKDVIRKDMNTMLKLHDEKNLEERGFQLKPLVTNGKLNE
ncbi:unnamed protein product [Caenorhabditis angaria]|uniref:P53 and DNA damage-regulated protein 1 n=1 Tax=Caenorhabditis angaria TaxID=860376 RepID=A0A9P1IAG4_9PELO|nr:unnamed protein product [Caenorhabditis angaria]